MTTDFFSALGTAAEAFQQTTGPVTIVSHFDCDGLAAAALLVKTLQSLDRTYTVTIIRQLDEETLSAIDPEQVVFFLDLGSSRLQEIGKLPNTIFILDHHEYAGEAGDNVIHVNPHDHGINGGKDISGSGVTYYFCKRLYPDITAQAYLAVIGALGEQQESYGFFGLNQEILEEAEAEGCVHVQRHKLSLFRAGQQTVEQLLLRHPNLRFLGLRDEQDVDTLLRDVNVDKTKSIPDLTPNELEALTTKVLSYANESEERALLRPAYFIPNEPVHSPLRDCREFATLLNACGRMDKGEIAIAACLGDEEGKIEAEKTVKAYRQQLKEFMVWYKQQKYANGDVEIADRYIIIKGGTKINPDLVGIVASIVSRFEKGERVIVALARRDDKIKVSLRRTKFATVHLRKLAERLVLKFGGDCGGHEKAAGAVIPADCEEDFLAQVKKAF